MQSGESRTYIRTCTRPNTKRNKSMIRNRATSNTVPHPAPHIPHPTPTQIHRPHNAQPTHCMRHPAAHPFTCTAHPGPLLLERMVRTETGFQLPPAHPPSSYEHIHHHRAPTTEFTNTFPPPHPIRPTRPTRRTSTPLCTIAATRTGLSIRPNANSSRQTLRAGTGQSANRGMRTTPKGSPYRPRARPLRPSNR